MSDIAAALTYKGKIGWSCDGTLASLRDWSVPLNGPFPTQQDIDAWDAERIAAGNAEGVRKLAIHDDPLRTTLLGQLKTATNAQISAYVDANVTDLPSARVMLKRIIMVIALDARNGN